MTGRQPGGVPGDVPGPRRPEAAAHPRLHRLLEEDPADLYENAPCGYLSMLPDGTVVRVNRTFCAWTGRSVEQVLGARFPDLLDVGGRIFSDTHLVPLLRMQGAVREIVLDVLRLDGSPAAVPAQRRRGTRRRRCSAAGAGDPVRRDRSPPLRA